jgi:hypothetical protein
MLASVLVVHAGARISGPILIYMRLVRLGYYGHGPVSESGIIRPTRFAREKREREDAADNGYGEGRSESFEFEGESISHIETTSSNGNGNGNGKMSLEDVHSDQNPDPHPRKGQKSPTSRCQQNRSILSAKLRMMQSRRS